MKVIPVILAGGAGKRLWPLSRGEKPKQFHNLSGKGTLLEETINRLIPLNPETYLVATASRYADASKEIMKKINVDGEILAEPFPKNTAAAVLYAATYITKISKNSIMIVLPADHYIRNEKLFVSILKKAVKEAEKDNLVTIGIKPSYPETGYGYIKAKKGDGDVRQVEMFVEKPNMETAKKYILDGNYYWNSGIFIWKTETVLDYFNSLMPGHYAAFEPLRQITAEQFVSEEAEKIKEQVFSSIESISIDYGIMEKAKNRVVIPSDFGWADLGSWKSIDDILSPDENMNRTPGREGVIFVDSRNCSVFADDRRVAVVGLSNVVIVESGNDILVMDKNASQEVRRVVDIVNKMESSD